MIVRRLFAFLFILAAGSTLGQAQIEMHVLQLPTAVEIEGQPVIYYELVLTNRTSSPQVLKRLTVLDTVNSATMRVFEAKELLTRYAALPPAPAATDLTLAPGASGLVYVELTLLNFIPAIPHYAHVLEVADASGTKTVTLRGGFFETRLQTPVVLGPPLRGGPWAAVYEPSWIRGHRRVFDMFGGGPQIAGRFAIDFMLLDTDGKMANGDKNTIANWYSYGADVLAVSDGRVTGVEDYFPESATLTDVRTYTASQAAGNRIVLEMDNDHYVVYEHLKPQSIVVKMGQYVKKGDRIAAVGFTGQSTGPHLHLHVADRYTEMGAEGLPFIFERFTLLGAYPGGKGLGERRWVRAKPLNVSISQQRPGPNAVINFE